MKVSVPSSYSRGEPAKTLELRAIEEPTPQPDPRPEPCLEVRPSLSGLSADWWKGFLYGNSDALLGAKDAQGAVGLIAAKLGKEAGQLDINGSIRSSELRKKLYEKFGADLALYTMQALWLEASSNGELSSVPAAPEMSETVAKFFDPEEPVPPWRLESAKIVRNVA